MRVINRFPDMNAFLRPAILGLACFALPGVAVAQTAAASATVEISQPLSVTVITSLLDFGHLKGDDMSLADGGMNGTVIVDPEPLANRTATGGAALLGVQTPLGGNFGLARLEISGEQNASYTISIVPASPLQATSQSSPRFLEVIALKSFTMNNNGTDAGQLNSSGEDVVLVGGELFVPARTRPGKFVVLEPILLIINY